MDNRKAGGFNNQEHIPITHENQLHRFAAGITRSEFCDARAWHPDEWGGFEDREPGNVGDVPKPNTLAALLRGAS